MVNLLKILRVIHRKNPEDRNIKTKVQIKGYQQKVHPRIGVENPIPMVPQILKEGNQNTLKKVEMQLLQGQCQDDDRCWHFPSFFMSTHPFEDSSALSNREAAL